MRVTSTVFFSVLAILWFDDNDMDTLPQPNSYNITLEVLCRSVSVNWISCVRPQLFPPFPQWNQDFWEWNADIHGLFQVFSVDFSEKHFKDWGTNSILPNTILLSSSVTLNGEVKSSCQTLYFSPNILCLTRDLESRYSAIFRSSGLVDDSDQQLLFRIHESLRATEPRNV